MIEPLTILVAVAIVFAASFYCGKWWQLSRNTQVRMQYVYSVEYCVLSEDQRLAVSNAFDYVRNYE